MINWATEDEINRFSNYEFRVLTIRDFPEFAQAYRESIHSMSTYLDLGYFSQQRPYLEMLRYFQNLIRSQTFDLFGIFDDGKLLGVADYYWTTFSENGTQITLWMREGAKNKGLGTYFMKRLTSYAFYAKKFRFVELVIDEQNLASRRMAEKVGFELMEIVEVETQGKLGSGKYCRYILFNGELEGIAENYHKQPIDLIDHPAYEKQNRSLIHDDWVNSYLKWPFEILNKRVYVGEPYGIQLDKTMLEVNKLEEEFVNQQRSKLRPVVQSNDYRINLRWAN